MPGIREVAGEAGWEDVTHARRRPSSGVPRDKAARVARRPPSQRSSVGLPAPRPPPPTPRGRGASPPPAPALRPRPPPPARVAGPGWAGLGSGRSGSRPFLGVSSLRADLREGARRAAAAAAEAPGVPRRSRFGALGHHDGKVTAPGRRAPLAREGGCATGPPARPEPFPHAGLARPLHLGRSRAAAPVRSAAPAPRVPPSRRPRAAAGEGPVPSPAPPARTTGP